MAWEFVVTDLNGDVIGEVTEAKNRSVKLSHMRVPTASFVMPLWHHLADDLIDNDTLIKAYRTDPIYGTKSLAFIGPTISVEETADESSQTVAVNASGPFWRLTKRLLSTSKAGVSYGDPTPIPLSQIAHNILTAVNGDSFTGISTGTRDDTGVVDGSIGPIWMDKDAATAIAELHVGIQSFEYVNSPTEPTDVGGVDGWPQIAEMDIAATIGSNKQDAIFEYGTTKANVKNYKHSVDREGMLTRAAIGVEGWPDAPVEEKDVIVRESAVATRGLFEEQVPHNNVVNDSLRADVADFHLKYRKNPRRLITFQPVANSSPSPITDYNVGDTVRARALVRGVLRFDQEFRVWGISFNIDDNGNEAVDLQLVEEQV